jgi:hypothetical protein
VAKASRQVSLVRVGKWSRHFVCRFGSSRLCGRSFCRGFLRGLFFLIVDCGYPLFWYLTEGLLAPPFLAKKDDPGVSTIECLINQKVFHKTFYDIRSGVNIMSKVTYEYLFGNEPLYPTYMQLQMADQSVQFPEGIAKDVII